VGMRGERLDRWAPDDLPVANLSPVDNSGVRLSAEQSANVTKVGFLTGAIATGGG